MRKNVSTLFVLAVATTLSLALAGPSSAAAPNSATVNAAQCVGGGGHVVSINNDPWTQVCSGGTYNGWTIGEAAD